MFLPAKVMKSFKPGEEGQIKFEDGKVRAPRAARPRPRARGAHALRPPARR